MDTDKLSMLTDFYELTMLNGFFLKGKADSVAVFDAFFRERREGGYCIACGLEQAAEYILNLSFSDDDISYLRSLNFFGEEFLKKLKDFKFSGDVRAIPEGTVVFPHEPLLIVKAPVFEAQLIESTLLNLLNFQTMIATKAARVNTASGGKSVIEFGLRRAQAPDAAYFGARAAVIAGCDGTSNVLASKDLGTKPMGTHAHSWVMAFDSELEAFRDYAEVYPQSCMLLIDTYDTLKSGLVNAITVFKELRAKGFTPLGVRLDSGDLAYLSKEVRKGLDEAGFQSAKIFASSDLDEYVISSLSHQGAKIDAFGVGTRLITGSPEASLGGVYKLAAFEKNKKLEPKVKVSDNPAKVTNPGEKDLFRFYDRTTHMALGDLITLKGETIDESKPFTLTHPTDRWKNTVLENFYAKPLYVDLIKNGKLVYDFPSIQGARAHCKASLDSFWEEYKRIDNPQIYKVNLSDGLFELKQRLLLKGK